MRYAEKKAPGSRDRIVWFEKGDVNGKESREVFSFLKNQLADDDGIENVSWNFTKFLVDHEGNACQRFSPSVNPLDIKKDIEKLLTKAENGGNES